MAYRLRWLASLIALWLSAARAQAQTLDEPPKVLHFVEAAAPASLAERGQVDVVLGIDVDENGHIGKVTVEQSGGDEYDQAAIAAVKQFVISPGKSAGKPVSVHISYAYHFKLKPAPPPAPPPPPPASDGTPSPEPAAPPVETVPLDGAVREKGERTPLAGVLVAVGEAETRTNPDGKFHFDALPIGRHKVKLRSPEILNADLDLELVRNKRLEVTWFVARRERYSTTVRGQRVVQETVEHQISGEELRHIPGTQGDTLRAVQTMPGVARAPFGGGQIIVWGTAPSSTRSYVDGVYIPTLYHFGGLRSTLNGEMVENLTFSPGGFGADYGRGYGGVIEIDTRKPKDSGIHGFVQLDLIDASLMIDAKITKTLSLTAAVRRSTIDAWLPYVTPNNFQLTPTYYDYQLKLHWQPTANDDLEVFFFGSDDQLSLSLKDPDPAASAALYSHTFYHRFLAKYQHRFGKATFTITPWFGYDQPFAANGGFGSSPITFDVHAVAYGLRAVARIPVWSWLRADVGLDFEGSSWNLAGEAPFAGATGMGMGSPVGGSNGLLADNVTLYENNTAPYASLVFSVLNKRLTITTGFRLDVYTMTGYRGTPQEFTNAHTNPEPRFQARYQINRWAAVKAAMGAYFEPAQPFQFVQLVGNPKLDPAVGWHYVLGADFDPTKTLHIEVEGFYKDLRNVIVSGERAGEPILENDGIGRVYGGELMVRQELWKNFFGWISYTLSRSEQKDHPDTAWHLFQYDQTHIFTLVASYKFKRGYQLGIRFRYVTGNPYTPIAQAYYSANARSYVPIQGPLYSQRLSDFNQLDIRFDKTWTFNRWKLSAYLDLQNVYNYRSEEAIQYNYNYTQKSPVAGLPIIPDLGIRGDF